MTSVCDPDVTQAYDFLSKAAEDFEKNYTDYDVEINVKRFEFTNETSAGGKTYMMPFLSLQNIYYDPDTQSGKRIFRQRWEFQYQFRRAVDFTANAPNWRGVRDVFYTHIRDLFMGKSPDDVAREIDEGCNAAISSGREQSILHE